MNNGRIPEYGDGGDLLGSRRSRQAFRLSIAACVVLTGMLWLSEYFLRHEHTERLFLHALTLEPQSGRSFLRQAVAIDKRQREFPTPKYLFALAVREEDDRVLSTFEEAYRLDPGNSGLAIRYGCRLLREVARTPDVEERQRLAVEARERFREAARNAPQNALPLYLEAAALPWVDVAEQDIRESLAIISRTNYSDRHVNVPRLIWSSDLPSGGWWHAELRRQLVEECCIPLYQFAALVLGRAETQVELEQFQDWDYWLSILQEMGLKLAESAAQPDAGFGHPGPGCARQAMTGVHIAVQAIRMRERIAELEQGRTDSEFIAQRVRLESVLAELLAFDDTIPGRIAADRARYAFPRRLVVLALAIVLGFYVLSLAGSKLRGRQRSAWTLEHSALAKAVLGAGAVALFFVLLAMAVLQRTAGAQDTWMTHVENVWIVLLLAWLGFGLVYPAFRLPSAHGVAALEDSEHPGAALAHVRAKRISAYAILLRRYFGIAWGFLLAVICVWVLSYRVLFALYPWQLKLLTTGLGSEEAELVQRLVQSL
jgi:hypothetical protein